MIGLINRKIHDATSNDQSFADKQTDRLKGKQIAQGRDEQRAKNTSRNRTSIQ
jgi:hypothetical protein